MHTEVLKQVRAGNAFATSSGRVLSSAVGNWRGVLKNPATHTKNLFLYRAEVCANLPITYMMMSINPTTGLPGVTNRRYAYNVNFTSATTSPVTLDWDFDLATPLGGGIPTPFAFPVANDAGLLRFEFPPLVIPPGISLGFNVSYSGIKEGSLLLWWWEE